MVRQTTKDLSPRDDWRFAGNAKGADERRRRIGPGSCLLAAAHRSSIENGMQPCWDKLKRLAIGEVEATLEALPAPLRARARAVPVTLERRPGRALLEEGYAPDTLGMFSGAPFAEEGQVPLPPQIILFLLNLWEFAGGDEEVYREEVRTTYLHELGHYLGLSEEELTDRGLE
jgi:predicted Zn-dependent protease with MMP-like domain